MRKNKEINHILETGFRVDINVLENSLNQEIAKEPNCDLEESEPGTPSLDATASELMRSAIKEAYICDNSPYVEPKHVLLALLKQNNNPISNLLSGNGITYDSLRDYLKTRTGKRMMKQSIRQKRLLRLKIQKWNMERLLKQT